MIQDWIFSCGQQSQGQGYPHTPNSQIPQRTDYCQVTCEVLVLLGTVRAEPVLFSVRFRAAQVWKVPIPV